MTIDDLLDSLGYTASENYLREDKGHFNNVVDYGHLFRRAAKKPCHLQGVYALRDTKAPVIPVVYICDAPTEADAKEVHRLVWNQNTVPFLVVNSPDAVRVYPGFCREGGADRPRAINNIHEAFDTADLKKIADTLSACAVDKGDTWRAWGRHIRPEYRVDWSLLGNLRKLDKWLQGEGQLSREHSHALIGKYVYLHYLRDREILSLRKLERWHIDSGVVFGRNATRDGLQDLQAKLDEWLNGEVFPIDFGRHGAPKDEHVAQVAATFQGDEPLGAGQWQLHLDFKAYNFSYIPIEVLSVVYEQFLHEPGKDGGQSRGRSAGAYYTPIPVVNLMLSELEEHRPLGRGTRVFDPACGSGAFLVQAFRRLIEKEFPPASYKHVAPRDLRDLVETHFIGLDADEDACRVTKLSLILTMLDYVHPPDLETDARLGPKPPLPNLRDNILCGNFFDDTGDWKRILARKKADWVVGNPPWKQLKSKKIREEDRPVLAWMKAEDKRRPVGNYQMARAFAWRVAEYVSGDGEIAMFLPSMSLFEEAAKRFRSRFFKDMAVHSIANFSNLRRVISGGRFLAPAAALFYRPRAVEAECTGEESIRTYSPLVANQEATRPVTTGKRNETWSIVINASEIREVPLIAVADGDRLPWKVAAWGSELDAKLLRSLRRRFGTIEEMERHGTLVLSEGLQLRREAASKDEGLERVSLPHKAKTIDLSILKGARNFFALPPWALKLVPPGLTYARKGRAKLALSICRPPHLILGGARTFVVYSEKFIIVPPRQIGIVSPDHDKTLLKALALFLGSDLAFYCEFFLSTGLGVERDRSTIKTLSRIPTPLAEMGRTELKRWSQFYDKLASATRKALEKPGLWGNREAPSKMPKGSVVKSGLVDELNNLVFEAFGLASQDRKAVQDFVRIRFALNDGKLGILAVGRPPNPDLRAYASRLKSELDSYIEGELSGRHIVEIVYDENSGMVRVILDQRAAAKGRVLVAQADEKEAVALEKCRSRIRETRSQWVYFDRNLRVYDGDATYVLKPMQRFHWTETQARVDAMEIVAESIARRGGT